MQELPVAVAAFQAQLLDLEINPMSESGENQQGNTWVKHNLHITKDYEYHNKYAHSVFLYPFESMENLVFRDGSYYCRYRDGSAIFRTPDGHEHPYPINAPVLEDPAGEAEF
ncbi:hypothetical protein PHLCEN_2v6173 [Hermanssonia centrifuga]|uniref:Uncharacterized protein n=1 Tax=Hermanssonia centrifuga TaxID=98765 RepID=A0A2R6P042_9APHY|nr:hypothetical protein PHLCEN_2v6173 [Hermanssonia centrifuga]